MKSSTFIWIALLATTVVSSTACGTGETGDRTDGLHGTTRPAPATDLSDTGNYRQRNENNDKQRGDTLPENVRDTAFHK